MAGRVEGTAAVPVAGWVAEAMAEVVWGVGVTVVAVKAVEGMVREILW